MRDAWPNSREASKSVAFTSSTVAPVEKRRGVGGVRQKEKFTEKRKVGRTCWVWENRNMSYPGKGKTNLERQAAVKWHSFFSPPPPSTVALMAWQWVGLWIRGLSACLAQHVLGTGVINILADREEEMLARAAGLALSCAASALGPQLRAKHFSHSSLHLSLCQAALLCAPSSWIQDSGQCLLQLREKGGGGQTSHFPLATRN